MKLDFVAPKVVGRQALTLFFMCDSYMGCDQVRGGSGEAAGRLERGGAAVDTCADIVGRGAGAHATACRCAPTEHLLLLSR